MNAALLQSVRVNIFVRSSADHSRSGCYNTAFADRSLSTRFHKYDDVFSQICPGALEGRSELSRGFASLTPGSGVCTFQIRPESSRVWWLRPLGTARPRVFRSGGARGA